jgi:hypothetical protein
VCLPRRPVLAGFGGELAPVGSRPGNDDPGCRQPALVGQAPFRQMRTGRGGAGSLGHVEAEATHARGVTADGTT